MKLERIKPGSYKFVAIDGTEYGVVRVRGRSWMVIFRAHGDWHPLHKAVPGFHFNEFTRYPTFSSMRDATKFLNDFADRVEAGHFESPASALDRKLARQSMILELLVNRLRNTRFAPESGGIDEWDVTVYDHGERACVSVRIPGSELQAWENIHAIVGEEAVRD